eukprot:856990-Rhodomonas_salina.2
MERVGWGLKVGEMGHLAAGKLLRVGAAAERIEAEVSCKPVRAGQRASREGDHGNEDGNEEVSAENKACSVGSTAVLPGWRSEPLRVCPTPQPRARSRQGGGVNTGWDAASAEEGAKQEEETRQQRSMEAKGEEAGDEDLDDGGDAGEGLEDGDPEEELLHGALVPPRMSGPTRCAEAENGIQYLADGDVVKLHHGSIAEGLLHAGELSFFVLGWCCDSHLDDHAGGGKHGDAAVLDLSLARPAEVEPVAEAERVEADVTDEGAIQVLGAVSARDGVNAKALEHALLVQLHGRAP